MEKILFKDLALASTPGLAERPPRTQNSLVQATAVDENNLLNSRKYGNVTDWRVLDDVAIAIGEIWPDLQLQLRGSGWPGRLITAAQIRAFQQERRREKESYGRKKKPRNDVRIFVG